LIFQPIFISKKEGQHHNFNSFERCFFDEKEMKTTYLPLLISVLLFSNAVLYGQDALFTQFYVAPQQTNPALVGTTPHYRASLLYRNQWSAIPQNYETAIASYDYNFGQYSSGIGVQFLNERVRTLGINHQNITFAYSYAVRLDRKWVFRPALQIGLVYRSFNFSRLTFADQIETGVATAERSSLGNRLYPTIGSGFLLYNKEWIVGLGSYHLNRPQESKRNYEDKGELAVRITAQVARKLVFSKTKKETKSLTTIALYQYQAGFQQLDIGANLFYSPLLVGLWYRGLPLLGSQVQNIINQDALAFVIGFRHDNFRITYSYDRTLSKLVGSGGSHEISVGYEPFADFRPRKKRDYQYVECPLFMGF